MNWIKRASLTNSLIVSILVIIAALSGCIEVKKVEVTPAVQEGGECIIDANQTFTAHFMDVGQGDSILLKFRGKNVLIDGGTQEMGPRISSYLKRHGVKGLDLVVSTHPHSDHIGGLLIVLKEFPVRLVLDSGEPHTSRTYENFLILIDQMNIPYKVAEAGQVVKLDPDIKIRVLSPQKEHFKDDLNQNSIVLLVTYDKVSFLLASDAGLEAERVMVASGFDLNSQILKVGHHGSRYSSSPAFLEQVTPEVSIIQVGKDNDYGHPSLRAIKLLQDIGSTIYRTDLNGDIVVVTDGARYCVIPQRAEPK